MVTVECISSKAPTLIRVYYNLKVYELFDIFTCHSTEKLLHRKCGPPTLSLSLSLSIAIAPSPWVPQVQCQLQLPLQLQLLQQLLQLGNRKPVQCGSCSE